MAKDVIFESERIEKRRSRLRRLIPVLGVLVVLIAIVAVALILRGGRTAAISGGEDTPYPYTWTVDKTGVATLEIDCSAAPGYAWQSVGSSGQVRVAPAANGKAGKTAFTVLPIGEGRALLSFVLQNINDPADRIYELNLLAEVGTEKDILRALPVNVAGHPLQGTVRGGADAAFPYAIGTDADGDLYITVTLPQASEEKLNALAEELRQKLEAGEITADELLEAYQAINEQDSDWDCDSSNESIGLSLGVIYGDGEVAAYFRSGAEIGNVTLRLFDRVSGACITAECENGAGGLLVLSHTLTIG